jgi:uncharacterized protein (TIGR02300 family)
MRDLPAGPAVFGLDTPASAGDGGGHFSEHGEYAVAKPNLGFKRVCGNCGTKFYDFGRTPIVCPKCETVYVVSASTRAAARAEPVAAAAVVEEVDVPVADAEVISLEEADAEATGKKKAAAGDADVDADEEEVEVATDDDDTFLEEEEEEAGNVSDIIGEKLEEDRET